MRTFLLASSLALLATAGAAAGAARAAEVALPPFYQALGSLPLDAPLGTVLAREPVATAVPGAEAWRIAYVSSDARGRKTLSTALVVAPSGAPPAEGRPIVAWAHGTTGTAQNCGPSQVFDPAQDLNEYFLVGGTSWTDFGVPALTHFIAKGYAVVATDYQGLGGGGAHQYAVAASNARDAVNSVRALGSMGLAGTGKKAMLYGWSQGGGATLAAASLTGYVSETGTAYDGISFVGFVAMAPDVVAALVPPGADAPGTAPKLMGELARLSSGNVFDFAHFSMNMWAMPAAFPELRLTDLFTADGARALDEIYSKKCMHAGSDTISFNFGSTYKSMIRPDPQNAALWVKALVEGSVAPVTPMAPVMIYYGDKDTTVDPAMGASYQKQMCAKGGNVTRVQLPGEQSHFTTPPAAEPLYVPWVDDLFAGKAAANGCPAN